MLTREDVVKIIYDRNGPIQRFTQDSPVLPDVWIAFAERPTSAHDVLLTPYQSALAFSGGQRSADRPLTPGALAKLLKQRLEAERATDRWKQWARVGDGGRKVERAAADIAYNQSTVAVCLWFDELVRVVLPLSHWWATRLCKVRVNRSAIGPPETAGAAETAGTEPVTEGLTSVLGLLQDEHNREILAASLAKPASTPQPVPPDVLWSIHVIGTIALAHETITQTVPQVLAAASPQDAPAALRPPDPKDEPDRRRYFRTVVDACARLVEGMSSEPCDPMVYLVSRNRKATATVWRSSVAVKADAAVRLFNISCSGLTWAVLDSGIDAWHPAFRAPEKPEKKDPNAAPSPNAGSSAPFANGRTSRVVATFDFRDIRKHLSVDANGDGGTGTAAAAAATAAAAAETASKAVDENAAREELQRALNHGREIDWSLVIPLIEKKHDASYTAPTNEHGTHVAGILGADWRADPQDPNHPLKQDVKGMCPDINLYDLRVLNEDGLGDEFSVMAALQFVRFLNQHRDVMVIQGVNLSLSIPHDVLNYACGRTPVCDECERLVGAGVVVVASAGNEGYQTMPGMTTYSLSFYQSMNITDPGNAESVITVGATHRDSPHTYGVSYFSSRGPTGDGRSKPDIVAPGEKIEAPVPAERLKRMDGTSMAAPHVSGAAALLLARHRELIGRPRRVKEILCSTATDLGREKYFQGAGMVDVLRALQSV